MSLDGDGTVLRARGIEKSFGAVQVLRGVDFDVYPGEVVAIIGDNGAGKSTLINVLTGVLQPNAGEISFEGERTTFDTPHEARERGIETVYQDLAVAPQLDAVANNFHDPEHPRREGEDGRDRWAYRSKGGNHREYARGTCSLPRLLSLP